MVQFCHSGPLLSNRPRSDNGLKGAAVTAAESLGDAIRQLPFQPSIRFENLTIVSLVSATERDAGYLTLDEALATGDVGITEVNEAGRVRELKILRPPPEW